MCLWVALLVLLWRAKCHSWLECTDYKGVIEGNDYKQSLCAGFARNFDKYQGDFGFDRGYNYQPGNGKLCRENAIYSDEFPKATYIAGKSAKLVWPAKNHVADQCTNAYIPSTFLRLYMSCGTEITSLSEEFIVEDFESKGGFQNCPKFCDNMDKAVCFQDFTIPENALGECSFVWAWAFNSESDLYTACFEATVIQNTPGKEVPTKPLLKKPVQKQPQKSECCVATRHYAQCGGRGYKGETCCPCGTKCKKLNPFYYQCV